MKEREWNKLKVSYMRSNILTAVNKFPSVAILLLFLYTLCTFYLYSFSVFVYTSNYANTSKDQEIFIFFQIKSNAYHALCIKRIAKTLK